PHRDVVTAVRQSSAAFARAGAADGLAESPIHDPSGPSAVQPVEPVHPVEPREPPPPLSQKPARRDQALPLTADLSRLHVTVSRRFLEKLEAARAARSPSHPGTTPQRTP